MSEVDAVILDLGNVLVFHDNRYLFQRLGEAAGLSLEEAASRFDRGFWEAVHKGELGELHAAVGRRLGVFLDAPTFFDLWNCHFRVHTEVLPRVEQLVGRVRLALLSNTNAVHFDWVRPRLPILQRFDAVVLSHELGLAKPDPAFFQVALDRLGVPPHRAAFFDDLSEYVEAASRVGLHGRLFTDAPRFAQDLASLGL